jgi:V/A-type H+-transporting ATPase subunit K
VAVKNLRCGILVLMAASIVGSGTLLWAESAEPAGEAPLTAGQAKSLPVTGSVDASTAEMADVYRTIALAASSAFVAAVSIVGSGYAVGRIGSAALGAAAEKPELLTRSLLFVALAEGLAVLGFAIAMMLLLKIKV